MQSLGGVGDPILMFGGYTYPDKEFDTLAAPTLELEPSWAAAAWLSLDGSHWEPLNVTDLQWTSSGMHSAVAVAKCGSKTGSPSATCAYVAGGLTQHHAGKHQQMNMYARSTFNHDCLLDYIHDAMPHASRHAHVQDILV